MYRHIRVCVYIYIYRIWLHRLSAALRVRAYVGGQQGIYREIQGSGFRSWRDDPNNGESNGSEHGTGNGHSASTAEKVRGRFLAFATRMRIIADRGATYSWNPIHAFSCFEGGSMQPVLLFISPM